MASEKVESVIAGNYLDMEEEDGDSMSARSKISKLFRHGGSVYDAWFSCASNQVAQVLLTLPIPFHNWGCYLGSFFSCFMDSFMGSWTAYLICVLYVEHRTRKERKKVDFRNHVIQWLEVLDGLLGKYWRNVGLFFNFTFLLFGSMIQLIAWASNIYYINDNLDKRTWTYIFGACCETTVFIPSFHNYRIWSFLGLMMTTYTAWYLTIASLIHGQLIQEETNPEVFRVFMERMNSLAPPTRINHLIMDDDVDSETVSEAGDIGDRALHFSSEFTPENGVDPIPGDQKLQPCPVAMSSISIVKPSVQLVTPRYYSNGKGSPEHIKEQHKGLPKILDYVSCMIHLATFGILGVLTRYLLQKLFGPDGAGVTSDHTILYLDLPSNMVGSFLMGWFGVVFKGDISRVSEHLRIALTTGYLGSLTTFSGWNQKMLELSVAGHWLFSVLGFIIGLFLVGFSIIFGIETAKGFRWLIGRIKMRSGTGSCNSEICRRMDNYKIQLAVMAVCLVMLGFLWGLSSKLVRSEFKQGESEAELWLACLFGPLGVWIRWSLARLNGRGVWRARLLKWIPFGTLIANVSAACAMSALAIVKRSVNNWKCDTIVTGIQFGLLGCLSTVSTFASEFNAMRESMQPWRAYAYAMITICVSFCFGILIFCIPVWQMSLA